MKYDLTDQEIQLIGTALGQMPYVQVSGLIAKLQAQFDKHHETLKEASDESD